MENTPTSPDLPGIRAHNSRLIISELAKDQLQSDQAKTLIDLRGRFLKYLKSSGGSQHTVLAYKKNINRFIFFVDNRSKSLQSYRRSDFTDFLDALKPAGPLRAGRAFLGASAQNQLMSSIRSFIRYCYDDLEHPLLQRIYPRMCAGQLKRKRESRAP